uniref:Uncharacterized protein n=1 Tax=Anopheles farauti TaxID=69004 RepID=A0A182QDT1_9DIPT
MRPSWTQVSCGPRYPMMSLVHRSAVLRMLVTSSPYVSATSKRNSCPCLLKYRSFTSAMASVMAPEICNPIRGRKKGGKHALGTERNSAITRRDSGRSRSGMLINVEASAVRIVKTSPTVDTTNPPNTAATLNTITKVVLPSSTLDNRPRRRRCTQPPVPTALVNNPLVRSAVSRPQDFITQRLQHTAEDRFHTVRLESKLCRTRTSSSSSNSGQRASYCRQRIPSSRWRITCEAKGALPARIKHNVARLCALQ